MTHYDESFERMMRLIERRCAQVRCSVCGGEQLALILDKETVISETIAEALAAQRIVIAERPMPDPQPTWVCQACRAWVYYDGAEGQALRAI